MADPIFPPSGIDMDVYKQWLASQQGGPAAGGGEPLYLPDDSVSDLGSWMTNISKGSNLGTDMDYLIQNNLLNYGAYDPITTYEQGDAPGRRQIQRLMQGTPYQQAIAAALEMNGGDPTAAFATVQQIIANPQDDNDLAVIASAPKAYDETSGELTDRVDVRAVRDQLTGLGASLMSDPMGEMVNGQFMTSSTEDSPAMQALFKAAYTTRPGEGYDPYSFAPQGTSYDSDLALMDAERQALERYTQSQKAQRTAQNVADQAGTAVDKYNVGDPFGLIGPPTPANPDGGFKYADPATSQGPDGPMWGWDGQISQAVVASPKTAIEQPIRVIKELTRPNRAYNNAIKGVAGDALSAIKRRVETGKFADPNGGGMFPTLSRAETKSLDPQTNPVMRKAMGNRLLEQQKVADKAYRDQQLQTASDKRSWQDDSDVAFAAQFGDAQRRAMVADMLRQGRSPFDDERRGRNQSVYGR
jgi:hypothetical protein